MNSIDALKKENLIEIRDDELKPIMLEVMAEVHAFCEKNGIQYTLWGGTLLGAVRHNGFIPWDDDIDIAMTRDNYDRFIREFQSEHFAVVSCEENSNYIYPFAKVYDKRTLKDEFVQYGNPYRTGIEVDIFPLEAYQDAQELKKTEKKRAAMLKLWWLSILRPQEGKILRNAAVFAARKVLRIKPNKMARRINLQGRKLPRDGQNLVLYMDCNLSKPLCLEKSWYETLALHAFEQYRFYIPAGYDFVLKKCYGDYMKLPPAEKRVSHHSFKAYKIGAENE